NLLIDDLTKPPAEVNRVLHAVARGDLTQRMSLEIDGRPLKGEFRRSAEIVNTMVDQLNAFASEVTRVAREVGTEGKLGGQAIVRGVAGTWKDLTDSVNSMAGNLTGQVRNIAEVTTAVAMGDLSKKITVDVRGEILELKNTINTMVDQLNAFAAEVTRMAREVGTEGRLGGQADVRDVGGTWRDLTDSVNLLAANLTTQVRAMERVATAVTRGDLTRSIDVEAQGEVGLLKDSVNEMIRNLRDTTRVSDEQNWLKTNLARFNRLLQGQRNLAAVGRLVLSELAPLVDIQHGVFYVVEGAERDRHLRLIGRYASGAGEEPVERYDFGEGLIGQSAEELRRIVVTDVPSDYIAIRSALGKAPPVSIVVLPLPFEGKSRGILELASFHSFSEIHLSFLDQLAETLGIVLNTISTNVRTEELVQEQAGRAEAEAGLARLRQVVDVMPEAILISDAQGQVYLSNAAAAEIMGVVPTEVIPTEEDVLTVRRFDGSACPPEDQPLARAVFRSEGVRGEQLIVTNSVTGREVPILVNSTPLSDAGGAPAGGVAVFQDITPLRDLDRQKDEFLAAVSHDLKTPATIIKGRANLLQRALRANPDHVPDLAEGLEAIDDTTAQLVRIVDELLDQTRMRMGKPFALDLGPADLLKIARRLANEYQNISPRHVIRVESDLGGLLGDWDEARMERVVANLISNAVKYSPRGGEVLIEAAREERDGELFAILTVRDEGLGIPPDELGRIFEPYYRGTNVAATVSGTGVGLAGTRHIVEHHGGEISVASILGRSTTVTVRLPVIREPAELLDA
ncbi:MAG: hypothetical protein QOE42_2126, partial [Chloroflexota bacterium]|nr:hypothetical protein [Chloroflexota bacterium]